MNKDEIKSLMIKIGVIMLTSLATKYHIDGSTVTAFVTDVADAGVLAYGVADHWNMKKVPETAVAIQPAAGSPDAAPVGATVTGKVVG